MGANFLGAKKKISNILMVCVFWNACGLIAKWKP
jgi:hypothetical protein